MKTPSAGASRSAPRVSVVVPNYNHERYLARRIKSILSQTFQDFELILLDDASTDGSVRILEHYAGDPRVRLVLSDTNSGSPFAQWNRGVELACGELVWIAEADDDAEPELLRVLVDAIDAGPATVLAYCQSWVIDESGRRIATKISWTDGLDYERWKRDYRNDGRHEASRYLPFQNSIPNASAVVFRRARYVQAGGAPTDMRLCGDWMTWARLAIQGDVAYVSQPLNLFREHANTVRSKTSEIRELHEWLEIIMNIERVVGIDRAVRSDLALRVLNEWKARYWRQMDVVSIRLILRACSLLWRLDEGVALQFALFFGLQRIIGKPALRRVQQGWTTAKRAAGRRT